jgi:hypothetical protein
VEKLYKYRSYEFEAMAKIYCIFGTRMKTLMLVLLLAPTAFAKPGQVQPSPARIREIQAALLAKGYTTEQPDGNLAKMRQACRRIADEHHWQINRTPDARVLILLGLGNKYSNPYTAQQPGEYLDKLQRHETE